MEARAVWRKLQHNKRLAVGHLLLLAKKDGQTQRKSLDSKRSVMQSLTRNETFSQPDTKMKTAQLHIKFDTSNAEINRQLAEWSESHWMPVRMHHESDGSVIFDMEFRP